MLDENFFILQTWNALISKHHKIKILKKIGRHPIHANRAFGFLKKEIQEDLIKEYRKTKFAISEYKDKKAA